MNFASHFCPPALGGRKRLVENVNKGENWESLVLL